MKRSSPSMQAALLESFESDSLVVKTVSLPRLKNGEVLVRLSASSINPSDLVFLRGKYGARKHLPVIPGFEGAGTVVAAQGSARRWVGRRVACRAPENGDGTWAEYMACPGEHCVPLLNSVSLEEGASLLVNPLTAWTLLSLAHKQRAKAFVQTAASSAVGRMMARLARREQFPAIHLVRRPEQAALLKEDGITNIIDTSQPDFEKELQVLCDQLKADLAFDAVGGRLTGTVANALRPGGKVLVYGSLGGTTLEIAASSCIFEAKSVEGFWLTSRLKGMSATEKLRITRAVQQRIKDDLRTTIQARFPLDQINQAIALYKEERTAGKVLLTFEATNPPLGASEHGSE